MNLSPALKGLITGVLMASLIFILFTANFPANTPLAYVKDILYAGGIAWTLFAFTRSGAYKEGFGPLFGQGFRCFIVVTLVMVAFTSIFTLAHPEFKEEVGAQYKTQLISEKNKTPSEIEALVAKAKKQYIVSVVSVTIFRYLIVGAVLTAAGSAALMRRK